MKRILRNTSGRTIYNDGYTEDIYCMTNINPKKSGLRFPIWSDAHGISRNVSHKFTPSAKIITDDAEISVTVEPEPTIVRGKSQIKQSDMRDVKEAMEYIGRNYDVFLKHYNDTTYDFDDESLFQALRERGEYR